MGDERAIKPLIEMSKDMHHVDEVKKALVYIGRKSPGVLMPCISDLPSIEMRFLCDVMAEVAATDYFDIFVHFLEHDDGHVRSYAVKGLARIGDERAVPYLMKKLDDQYEDVQESVVHALLVLKDGLDTEELLELIKRPDPFVRQNALLVLSAIHPSEVVTAVSLALKDEDPRVRMAGAKTLSTIKSDEAFLGLLRATADEDPAIRALVVRCLGDSGLERFIDTVGIMLSDADPVVRVAAAKAMSMIGTRNEVMLLVPMLEDDNGHVCVSAIEALGVLGGREAKAAILKMLVNEDSEIKRTALRSLAGFHGVEDVLLDYLDDKDWAIRVEAVRALKGHRQSNVIEKLEHALLSEADTIVQHALKECLDVK